LRGTESVTVFMTFSAASQDTFPDTMYAGTSRNVLSSIPAGDAFVIWRPVDEQVTVSKLNTTIRISCNPRRTYRDIVASLNPDADGQIRDSIFDSWRTGSQYGTKGTQSGFGW